MKAANLAATASKGEAVLEGIDSKEEPLLKELANERIEPKEVGHSPVPVDQQNTALNKSQDVEPDHSSSSSGDASGSDTIGE